MQWGGRSPIIVKCAECKTQFQVPIKVLAKGEAVCPLCKAIRAVREVASNG